MHLWTTRSGTRGVVSLLQDLGINFVIEDKSTLDVHAREAPGAWPGVIRPILAVSCPDKSSQTYSD